MGDIGLDRFLVGDREASRTVASTRRWTRSTPTANTTRTNAASTSPATDHRRAMPASGSETGGDPDGES
jgi:hypothetical protein